MKFRPKSNIKALRIKICEIAHYWNQPFSLWYRNFNSIKFWLMRENTFLRFTTNFTSRNNWTENFLFREEYFGAKSSTSSPLFQENHQWSLPGSGMFRVKWLGGEHTAVLLWLKDTRLLQLLPTFSPRAQLHTAPLVRWHACFSNSAFFLVAND